MTSPDKAMPHSVIDSDLQWVGSVAWYDDFFLLKNSTTFQIVRFRHTALEISSNSHKDAGNEERIKI